MSSQDPRLHHGLGRRERAGWIAGLTPVQALSCMALALPAISALSADNLGTAALLALSGIGGGCLIVLPVRGRPAVRWLGHWAAYQVGAITGWSRWRSAAASGLAAEPGRPDLPGALQRLAFPDGPPLRDHGRICLIHDTTEGRWGATAVLTHAGVGMLSGEDCERLAAQLGGLLVSLGHRDVIDRVSLLVRTVPDDGTRYAVWAQQHRAPDPPGPVLEAAGELDGILSAASVRHEVFLTVSGREDVLRRPAAAAGGGVAGRAHVLYRELDGLDDALRGLGVRTVRWLTAPGLAEAIRTGFNPAAAAALTADNLTRPENTGLPFTLAGPAQAPTPSARAYHHDGFSTASYAVLIPDTVYFGSLAPLLAVRSPGERRTLAVHYEILDQRRAARAVRATRFRSTVTTDWKSAKGFTTTARDQHTAAGAHAQEHAVVAGHALVRYTVAASVTVPRHYPLDDHAARLESDAVHFRLLRLELAQDSAFVVACLPVGLGLPRNRATWS